MTNTERDLEYQPYSETLEYQVRMIRELLAGEWQKAPGFVRRLEEAGVAPGDLSTHEDILKFLPPT